MWFLLGCSRAAAFELWVRFHFGVVFCELGMQSVRVSSMV